MKLGLYLTPYTKTNLKWIKDLYLKAIINIKLLEKNLRANLHDLGFGNVFLNMTPKA